jgi:hypothetical protein
MLSEVELSLRGLSWQARRLLGPSSPDYAAETK